MAKPFRLRARGPLGRDARRRARHASASCDAAATLPRRAIPWMLNPMKLAAALALTSSMALPGALATDNPTALGIGYICSAEHFVGPAGSATAVMLAGVGDGVWPADTKN